MSTVITIIHMNKFVLLGIFFCLTSVAMTAFATGNTKQNGSVLAVEEVSRNIDPVSFSKGRRLFLQNCARCHGMQGEGAKNWQRPDEEGKNKPPPLNGTGHSWHHSPQALMNTIKNGTGKIGGNMPGWKDKLTDGEIKLILSWIKAQWPDEIYTAWYNRYYQTK
jgi:mono/diheme cytochrome c family protein